MNLNSLGAGAIYPVPASDIVIPDFEIPAHWPRAYGLDVGWNRMAAVWAALDRDSDVLYLYSEHYVGKAEPSVHAGAVQARGKWIRARLIRHPAGARRRTGTEHFAPREAGVRAS